MSGVSRIDELSADRALFGLSPEEERELRAMLDAVGRNHCDPEWERAAAAATAVLVGRGEPVPPRLLAKLEADAHRTLRAASSSAPAPMRSSASAPTRWLIAAAIAIAAWAGWAILTSPASDAARRDALIASAADLLRYEWQSGPSDRAGDASGDVVWSDAAQGGFMRFSGLPANRPGEFQYQLWIFDRGRDAGQPVDGGVFDVRDAESETIVPIDAKLRVDEAFAFAVTVERPGGVVVSKREHIVTLAGL